MPLLQYTLFPSSSDGCLPRSPPCMRHWEHSPTGVYLKGHAPVWWEARAVRYRYRLHARRTSHCRERCSWYRCVHPNITGLPTFTHQPPSPPSSSPLGPEDSIVKERAHLEIDRIESGQLHFPKVPMLLVHNTYRVGVSLTECNVLFVCLFESGQPYRTPQ
jgi:hypothetical protein